MIGVLVFQIHPREAVAGQLRRVAMNDRRITLRHYLKHLEELIRK